jgi:predicted DCC family thiol-disulfide oxidoreductase YuxK
MTTMFYDGGCPVCMRGVRHYQKLDWARRIQWVNLLDDPDVLKRYEVDFSEAMERLHVLDVDGQLVSGVAAFVVLWEELPWYRVLALLTRLPGVRPVMNAVYDRMTRGRYARRCREGLCGVSRDAG